MNASMTSGLGAPPATAASNNSGTASVAEKPEPCWSISVKTVGAESSSGDAGLVASDFQVQVKPSDTVQTLHDRIEDVTGLKPGQQRLIYRGRLIGERPKARNSESSSIVDSSPSSNAAGSDTDGDERQVEESSSSNSQIPEPEEKESFPKIRDIKGLTDGHTIHLVRRPLPEETAASTETRAEARSSVATARTTENESTSNASSNPSSALLAALLGLSGLEEESTEDPSTTGTRTARNNWRRYGRRHRHHYRLTAEDLEIPDPGSMESVRQGLLTLHTMLPVVEQLHHVESDVAGENDESESSMARTPLDYQREWYRGQWIDCRDTVNQWLEATIVDLVKPEEILPPHTPRPCGRHGPTTQPEMDPAVHSHDLEGRRRLLLEPCEEDDEYVLGGDLSGFRPRDTNNGVVMLLIHYNGWPHRWDEWIRSDSERIRPFRVRTRHPTTNTRISPTTQSHYADSPETFIGGRTDAQDREHLLPELARVLRQVNELVEQSVVAQGEPVRTVAANRTYLPWRNDLVGTGDRTRAGAVTTCDDAIQEPLESASSAAPSFNRISDQTRRRELAALAPLVDRLGRTLVDAAPHLASLAASIGEPGDDADRGNSEGLGNSSASGGSSSLGGLLSLLNRDRHRRSVTDNAIGSETTAGNGSSNTSSSPTTQQPPPVDPDFMDFSSGLVNTSRGEVRSGPRSRASRDDFSGLLGAYLAAASLGSLASNDGPNNDGNEAVGRLLNRNTDDGNGGGGGGGGIDMVGRLLQNRNTDNGGAIDIHIHAVVTAPGMGGLGGMTAATLAGGGGGNNAAATPTIPTDLFGHTRRATAQRLRIMQNNEDDNGIFSDLYSETPEPADSNSRGISAGFDESILSTPTRRSQSRSGSSTSNGNYLVLSPGNRSSRRLESRSPSSSNNSNTSDPNRRSSFFGRLFRRPPSNE